ncbi:MAG: hypothetical protein M3Y72_02115 [Acidobacteriota bacterium]|nr:hypothetical protein [Acidobacteriota bacterium]
MSNTRRSLIPVLGCIVGSFAIAPSTVLAQGFKTSPPAYSLASYTGDYAVIGTYGANVARLIGTYHADGKGNAEGTARVNLPGSGNDRVVVNLTFAGPYVVNPDGTGTLFFTVELPGGGTSPATLDFVFTRSEVLEGIRVATEIATAQREPSSVVNGQFVTHISTRRSDKKHDRDDS